MVTVGVISDTHIPARAKRIPRRVFEAFEGTSLIIHAGDLTQLRVLEALEAVAPVVAAAGNMDEADIKRRFPAFNHVQVASRKIGVTHNSGLLRKKLRVLAEQQGLDVLVFGHTHRPSIRRNEKCLYINPGSPTNPMPPFFIKPTVGLLKISKEGVSAKIINV